MEGDTLATPCGLYCGFCRFYMNGDCRGCGSEDRRDCQLYQCCRVEKGLRFCTECEAFACAQLKASVGLHPGWLEELEKQPLERRMRD
jgi:hypothetical protein